jgi:hypothetical protein
MLKPALPSRPVEAPAAVKRAGALRTETPGSSRTRSLMSLTRPSSISSDEMTLTVTGTCTDFSERVAVTVTLSSSTASAAALASAA